MFITLAPKTQYTISQDLTGVLLFWGRPFLYIFILLKNRKISEACELIGGSCDRGGALFGSRLSRMPGALETEGKRPYRAEIV